MNIFKYELGTPVKDKITGYKGIIVGRSQFLTGCNRYAVQSKKLKDDKPAEFVYFDENQIDAVGTPISLGEKKEKEEKKEPGGPQPPFQFREDIQK